MSKIKKVPLRIVKDARYWREMEGNTPLEQMLNAYLTCNFIVSKDVPADECLAAAKKVIEVVRAYGESADSGAAWDELGRDWFHEHDVANSAASQEQK